MEPAGIALLLGAGLLAGAVNAVAGGGSFVTFSALVASGLTPIEATATALLAIYPAGIASTAAYRAELLANLNRFGVLTVIGLGFGAAGGWALIQTGDTAFRAIVPWLLLFATALFAAGPAIGGWLAKLARQGEPGLTRRLGGLGLHSLASFYGGYFGAGLGIVLLTTLTLTEGTAFHRINAAKNLLALVIPVLAAAQLVFAGLVDWPRAAAIAGSGLIGGWYGVVLARHIPVWILRTFVLGTGASLTVWFFMQ